MQMINYIDMLFFSNYRKDMSLTLRFNTTRLSLNTYKVEDTFEGTTASDNVWHRFKEFCGLNTQTNIKLKK